MIGRDICVDDGALGPRFYRHIGTDLRATSAYREMKVVYIFDAARQGEIQRWMGAPSWHAMAPIVMMSNWRLACTNFKVVSSVEHTWILSVGGRPRRADRAGCSRRPAQDGRGRIPPTTA